MCACVVFFGSERPNACSSLTSVAEAMACTSDVGLQMLSDIKNEVRGLSDRLDALAVDACRYRHRMEDIESRLVSNIRGVQRRTENIDKKQDLLDKKFLAEGLAFNRRIDTHHEKFIAMHKVVRDLSEAIRAACDAASAAAAEQGKGDIDHGNAAASSVTPGKQLDKGDIDHDNWDIAGNSDCDARSMLASDLDDCDARSLLASDLDDCDAHSLLASDLDDCDARSLSMLDGDDHNTA